MFLAEFKLFSLDLVSESDQSKRICSSELALRCAAVWTLSRADMVRVARGSNEFRSAFGA